MVTSAQSYALVYLAKNNGINQSTLAENVGLGKAAMGDIIDKLESMGFVERRPDPHDRRFKCVHITPRGLEINEKLSELSFEAKNIAFNDVSDQEILVCTEILHRINLNLQRAKKKRKSSN